MATFVECRDCGKDVGEVDGCVCNYLLILRIPNDTEDRCHDCGAVRGQYHHYGCDMEACPICGEQLIVCDCFHSGAEPKAVRIV